MECGECTLCCTLFEVKWLDKPINTPCKHCDRGCMIHKTKPDECSTFNCAYRQSSKANIAMRPDNSGVVFEKLSDLIVWGTCKSDPYKPIILGQIDSFKNEGFTVIIKEVKNQKPTIFFADDHSETEIKNEMIRLEGERNGNRHIYN